MASKAEWKIVEWFGQEVFDHYMDAAANGITKVMGDCVIRAQPIMPRRETNLMKSIKTIENGHREGSHGEIAVGLWGSPDIFYAYYIETGERSYMRGRSKSLKLPGWAKKSKGGRGPGANYNRKGQLRETGDKLYPTLKRHIRSFL